MTKERKALKLALEALKKMESRFGCESSRAEEQPTTFACRHTAETCPRCEGLVSGWKAVRAANKAIVAAEEALAQPEQEQLAMPRFNCWSTNDGDSWFDDPADADVIYDTLGDEPKVGDEFEIIAGWRSVTAKYRVTKVGGDGDCEVECISHPQESITPPQRTAAVGEDSKTWVGLTDADKDVSNLAYSGRSTDYIDGYEAGMEAAEDKLMEKNA